MTASILSIQSLSDNLIPRRDVAKALRAALYNTHPAGLATLYKLAADIGIDLDREAIAARRRLVWARHKASDAKKRAKALGLTEHYTPSQWLALVEFYDRRCVFCGDAHEGLIADHVIPLSAGGCNLIENIQPLCKRCDEFLERHGINRDHRTTKPDWFAEGGDE